MSISLKELKKNRLTPAEKWVLERIDGAEPKTNKYGNVLWWEDGVWLFTQNFKAGYLDVGHNVWVVLREEFSLNNNEIHDILANLLYDYTNKGKFKIY